MEIGKDLSQSIKDLRHCTNNCIYWSWREIWIVKGVREIRTRALGADIMCVMYQIQGERIFKKVVVNSEYC